MIGLLKKLSGKESERAENKKIKKNKFTEKNNHKKKKKEKRKN